MTGQMNMFDWISCSEKMPDKSGMYTVRDRKGRIFPTWYEKIRNGFNHVYNGVGYAITDWRMI